MKQNKSRVESKEKQKAHPPDAEAKKEKVKLPEAEEAGEENVPEETKEDPKATEEKVPEETKRESAKGGSASGGKKEALPAKTETPDGSAPGAADRSRDTRGILAAEPHASDHLLLGRRARQTRESFVGVGNPEGRLVNEHTDLPIVGMRVTAWVGVTSPDRFKDGQRQYLRKTLVGGSVSGRNGRFEISLSNDERAQRELLQLQYGNGATMFLQVERGEGEPYMRSDAIDPSGDAVLLRVPMPEREVPTGRWAEMAERIESSRMLRVNDVVRQLVEVRENQSLFADWNLEERHAAVLSLERALIDREGLLARHGTLPTFRSLRQRNEVDLVESIVRQLDEESDEETRQRLDLAVAEAFGKLSSFESLLDVDWLIDTQELKQGNLPKALAKFQPGPSLGHSPGGGVYNPDLSIEMKPTDPKLMAYRDYLRTILCGAPASDGFSASFHKLSNRLHQNFATADTTPRNANEILIDILKVILKSPKNDGYGFGLQASAIEPQGERSTREHLDYLISLTGTSAGQLGRRYRINFTRPDGAVSSRVQENVSTLQRFMTDSYQQEEPDPYDPFIPERREGWAPFFLHYDEWKSMHAHFFPENYYPLKQLFGPRASASRREYVETMASNGNEWFITMLQAGDALAAGHEARDKGQFTKAAEHYSSARSLAFKAIRDGCVSKAAQTVSGKSHPSLATLVQPAIDGLQAIQVSDKDGLEELIKYLNPPTNLNNIASSHEFNPWLEATLARHLLTLLRLGMILVPSCLAEVAAELGDYGSAVTYYGWTTRFLVMRADIEDRPGWYQDVVDTGPSPHWEGNLPYSCNPKIVNSTQVHPPSWWYSDVTWESYMCYILEGASHPVEQKYLRLLYAESILAWADALYRTDDAPSIQRARELYKAVLFIHGMRPGIDPYWPENLTFTFTKELLNHLQMQETTEKRAWGIGSTLQVGKRLSIVTGNGLKPMPVTGRSIASTLPVFATKRSNETVQMEIGKVASNAVLAAAGITRLPGAFGYLPLFQNPGMLTQTGRARLGIYQIEAGLNFYGLTDDLVPSLRYRPLKDAADQFAVASKSAQGDLLLYLGNVEESLKEQLFTAQLLKKAKYQSEISAEQVELARYNESLASKQVRAVEKEIEKKREELKEEQSFWNQAGDFFGGMVDAITGLPDDLTGSASSGTKASLGYGAYEGSGAFASLGAGGGVMAGYGMLVYAGYTSMSNLADRYESMADQIHHLEDSVLPMAKANLVARKRETRIAKLQQSISESDVEFAKNLIDFEEKRFLNIDFWNQLAGVMKRVLRRYLALGTRYGWLAERALAYEQDRKIDIIHLDYIPKALQSITGADLLQRDLGELEASRIDGICSAVPITHTFSLAFDFPLEFGNLRRTGRCTFHTSDLGFRLAYPGTYSHRIRAVTAAVRSTGAAAPFRGLLGNTGVSNVRGKTGKQHISIRPMESFPLSEFRLRRDMDVFSLPDKTLLTFEGTGVDTTWTLEFPNGANPYGLSTLLDVELTFDLRVHHSPSLYESDMASQPTDVGRSMLVSAAHHALADLEALRSEAQQVSVSFDMNAVGLPTAESDRTISNLVVLIAGSKKLDGPAEVEGSKPAQKVSVTFDRGIAASNAPPLVQEGSQIPPMPLNAFVGASVDQTFTVRINKANFPGIEFDEVKDIILGIEYRAKI